MKFISWNVNGLRACIRKGFLDFFEKIDADIFCIQETKLQQGQIELQLDGYHQFWNDAEKKGYSGTAIFTKIEPLSVQYDFDEGKKEKEGRVIILEFETFYLVNVYSVNAQRDLARLPLRMQWEDRMRKKLVQLDQIKPVILCGDLNVAHQEIDVKNAKSNIGNSGFTYEEREKMTKLLQNGFVDSFRYLYPTKTDCFTWWSYIRNVRERNIGWRIDYFLVSQKIADRIVDAHIYSHVYGSDHCPIGLEISL